MKRCQYGGGGAAGAAGAAAGAGSAAEASDSGCLTLSWSSGSEDMWVCIAYRSPYRWMRLDQISTSIRLRFGLDLH